MKKDFEAKMHLVMMYGSALAVLAATFCYILIG